MEGIGTGDHIALRWTAWLAGRKRLVRSRQHLLEVAGEGFRWTTLIGVPCAVDRGYRERVGPARRSLAPRRLQGRPRHLPGS